MENVLIILGAVLVTVLYLRVWIRITHIKDRVKELNTVLLLYTKAASRNPNQEYILCAAINYPHFRSKEWEEEEENDNYGITLHGHRHADIIADYYRLTGYPTTRTAVQGFLTSKGTFVDRSTAYDIAEKAGQLKASDSQRVLYSENLY